MAREKAARADRRAETKQQLAEAVAADLAQSEAVDEEAEAAVMEAAELMLESADEVMEFAETPWARDAAAFSRNYAQDFAENAAWMRQWRLDNQRGMAHCVDESGER
eukprot:5370456-Heterocapsa_arctica.AAC.1